MNSAHVALLEDGLDVMLSFYLWEQAGPPVVYGRIRFHYWCPDCFSLSFHTNSSNLYKVLWHFTGYYILFHHSPSDMKYS